MGKYGLRIHPEKTRLLPFKRPPSSDKNDRNNGTFDFLGFTHYWCRSRRGFWVIKRRTSRKRLKRALQRANQWCKENRHLPVDVQHQMLSPYRGDVTIQEWISRSNSAGVRDCVSTDPTPSNFGIEVVWLLRRFSAPYRSFHHHRVMEVVGPDPPNYLIPC